MIYLLYRFNCSDSRKGTLMFVEFSSDWFNFAHFYECCHSCPIKNRAFLYSSVVCQGIALWIKNPA